MSVGLPHVVYKELQRHYKQWPLPGLLLMLASDGDLIRDDHGAVLCCLHCDLVSRRPATVQRDGAC